MVSSPASTNGLAASRAMVFVAPPLSAKSFNPYVFPEEPKMLFVRIEEVNVPESIQLLLTGNQQATIEFSKLRLLSPWDEIWVAIVAEFCAIVLLTMRMSGVPFANSPPPD